MNTKPKFDIVGRATTWFALSGVMILIGLVGLVTNGLNLGVDFTGGSMYRYQMPARLSDSVARRHISALRAALRHEGLKKEAVIQVSDGSILFIRTAERSDRSASMAAVLAKEFKVSTPAARAKLSSEFVGPTIGKELKRQAIMGTVIGLLGICVWIWIRYNVSGDGFRYAVAGMISLTHDVLVMVGGFAIAGMIDRRIEADSSFVAAILTVVGYSINDTVVIFDRIRENLRHRRRDRFEEIVNDSLWQTMARSINTGLTVLIAITILFLFGGESIRSFSLALLIGIVSGAYSSIFNASPILVVWKKLDEKKKLAAAAVPVSRRAATTPPPARPLESPLPQSSTSPANDDPEPVASVVYGETPEAAERRRSAARKRGGNRRRF